MMPSRPRIRSAFTPTAEQRDAFIQTFWECGEMDTMDIVHAMAEAYAITVTEAEVYNALRPPGEARMPARSTVDRLVSSDREARRGET